jgi:hypothetical protein
MLGDKPRQPLGNAERGAIRLHNQAANPELNQAAAAFVIPAPNMILVAEARYLSGESAARRCQARHAL